MSWGGCFNRLVNLSILFISLNSTCDKSNTIFGITECFHSSDISVTWFSVGGIKRKKHEYAWHSSSNNTHMKNII